MRSVAEAVGEADAVLALVDAAARPQEALAMLQPGPDWAGPPMAVVRQGAWGMPWAAGLGWAGGACSPYWPPAGKAEHPPAPALAMARWGRC